MGLIKVHESIGSHAPWLRVKEKHRPLEPLLGGLRSVYEAAFGLDGARDASGFVDGRPSEL